MIDEVTIGVQSVMLGADSGGGLMSLFMSLVRWIIRWLAAQGATIDQHSTVCAWWSDEQSLLMILRWCYICIYQCHNVRWFNVMKKER